MSNVKWTIKGREFMQCNCAYGCPCQFNALPTHGDCRAIVAFQIDEGYHGDTRLDDLQFAMIAAWPGAIHEGNGEAVPIIDERASPGQREALIRIISGEDSEPGATIFQVFSATFEKVHDPIFTQIDFKVDVEERTARVNIVGLVESRGEPIVNPMSGETHRARITLPEGFEYDVCEVGRGWTEAQGAVKLKLADSHAQFAVLHLTESGVANHA